MEPAPTPPFTAPNDFGLISNGGTRRYLLEAESTTGFIAYRLADGTVILSDAQEVSLQQSPQITFWACAGPNDPTPAGAITHFDCHGNSLVSADVSRLGELQFLDCSFNNLEELNLSGLVNLEALDADNNTLATLAVSDLQNLRVLNCANNRIANLDLSGLDRLQILDCSGNPITTVNTKGCTALQQTE